MTRQQNIAILKAIYQGRASLADLLPKNLKIVISNEDGKPKTKFFINDVLVSPQMHYEVFEQELKKAEQIGETKIAVKIAR